MVLVAVMQFRTMVMLTGCQHRNAPEDPSDDDNVDYGETFGTPTQKLNLRLRMMERYSNPLPFHQMKKLKLRPRRMLKLRTSKGRKGNTSR